MINIKNNLYQLFFFTLFFIFINNTVHANNIKNSAVIFMYHKFDISQYPSTNIRNEIFKEQFLWIQDKIKEIIGKGGAVIKGMQADTGASVDVDESGTKTSLPPPVVDQFVSLCPIFQ